MKGGGTERIRGGGGGSRKKEKRKGGSGIGSYCPKHLGTTSSVFTKHHNYYSKWSIHMYVGT